MSTFSQKDLVWFRLANANPPAGFYAFKDRFLKRFARAAGWDLQLIELRCHACEGTGKWRPNMDCNRCHGSGLYDVKKVALERFELAGSIYHRPVQWHECPLKMWDEGQFVSEIEGRIQHEAVESKVAERCFNRLLLRHEPMTFYWRMIEALKWRRVVLRNRWRFRLWRLRQRLDLFGFKDSSQDEVPF